MKRIFSTLMVLALLICLTTALAADAGTQADPLVTQSYVDGTYTDQLLTLGTEKILEHLLPIYQEQTAGLGGDEYRTAGFHYLAMKKDSAVELRDGCSFLLKTGYVTVSIAAGTVLEISSGNEIASGAALTPGLRYFCVEDTTAVFTAVQASSVLVDGGFIGSEGVSPALSQYVDNEPADWYYDAARYAYDHALFPDKDARVFRAYDDTLRSEMVYALWMAVGCPESTTTTAFVDLEEDWYIPAVNWSVENGIINGLDETHFGPDDNLTREQMAAILYRYVESIGGDVSARTELDRFTDAGDIYPYAVEYLQWTCAMGIIIGMTETTLGPKLLSERAQVATILMRYVG